MLFPKKIKKLSPYPTSLYNDSQNFIHRFSHKTRRYVHKWRDAFVSKELFVNDLFCLMTIFPFLARSFCRIQGLGRIQSGGVLSYCEYLNLGRKRCSRPKETAKNKIAANVKANPFQTHPKPFFRRQIFDFRLKTGIFDKFRTTFLCKANPFYKLKMKDLQLFRKVVRQLFKN